jgi:hypothetical protein
MPRCWIAVASAEHVRKGRAGGFMQVCHGKTTPLRRITPGDLVVCYSPTEIFGGKNGGKNGDKYERKEGGKNGNRNRCQAFTAIGVVLDGEPYVFDMGGGLRPWRRNVAWAQATDAPIRPLLDDLDLTAGKPNWGYQFRFGLVSANEQDFRRIAAAMNATILWPQPASPGDSPNRDSHPIDSA